MSAWTGKPCQDCGKKKGAKQRNCKRCWTCQRIHDKDTSLSAFDKMLRKTYNITLAQRQELLDYQGGVCYLCRIAKDTGNRRLSVDHDHRCCPGDTSCGRCVRGLLCTGCNRHVLAWAARDDVAFFYRGIEYLTNPPFKAMLDAGIDLVVQDGDKCET